MSPLSLSPIGQYAFTATRARSAKDTMPAPYNNAMSKELQDATATLDIGKVERLFVRHAYTQLEVYAAIARIPILPSGVYDEHTVDMLHTLEGHLYDQA